MVNRRSPAFFKILLDASAPHLPLPPDFVSCHLNNNIPKNTIIRSPISGHAWQLKIKKIGECFCFTDGWDNVVEDIKLCFGDLLIFQFVDKSVFKMAVFSSNGCEKDIPPKVESDDAEVVEIDDDEVEVEVDDEMDGHGGTIDGDNGDPVFVTVISASHRDRMRLPMKFWRLIGIDSERTLTLKNLDGKELETRLILDKSNHRYYYVSAGWSRFRKINDLCEGDECVFKFIRNEDKLLLAKVNRDKRLAREVWSPEETLATKDGKRKVRIWEDEEKVTATSKFQRQKYRC